MCKKILCLLMVALLSVSVLAACGDDKDSDKKSPITIVADNEQKESTTEDTTASKAVEVIAPTTQPKTEAPANDNYIYADIDAMTAIEDLDSFDIIVKEKSIVKGMYDDGAPGVDFDGEDGIAFELQNNTGTDVDDIVILVFCTDGNGKGTGLGSLTSASNIHFGSDDDTIKYSNHVQFMGTDDAELSAYNSKEYSIQCDAFGINKVNAIVYSYVDADGNTVYNQNCRDWLAKSYEGYEIKTY